MSRNMQRCGGSKKPDTWPGLDVQFSHPVATSVQFRAQKRQAKKSAVSTQGMVGHWLWNSPEKGMGSFTAPIESTVDVEQRVMKRWTAPVHWDTFFSGRKNRLCLAPPCRMPQPQRSLYTGVTLNLLRAEIAEHKLPGHSHVTGVSD